MNIKRGIVLRKGHMLTIKQNMWVFNAISRTLQEILQVYDFLLQTQIKDAKRNDICMGMNNRLFFSAVCLKIFWLTLVVSVVR
jgi:hypothetical protein